MRIDPNDLARAGRERDDNSVVMKSCWCPPGTFHMGIVPDRLGRFQAFVPVGVTLRHGYWMGKFEVTQAQWQRVMGPTLREQRARDPSLLDTFCSPDLVHLPKPRDPSSNRFPCLDTIVQ